MLAIPVVKCLFMPTAEIALTADLVRSQGAFLSAALSFEDFQFSVLRLLIIRVRRDPGGEFRSRMLRRASPVTTTSRDARHRRAFCKQP